MCPFLVPQQGEVLNEETKYCVLTSAHWQEDFIKVISIYAQKIYTQTQSVLVFDGSLGLGDLCANNQSIDEENVNSVLQRGKALSTLVERQNNGIDLISGQSKVLNMGIYSEIQLQAMCTDLELLGKNYQKVLIYAPPTLPSVQRFFCKNFDSICLTFATETDIAEALSLSQSYPRMKCCLAGKKDLPDVTQALELGLANQKDYFLSLNIE